MSKRLLEVVYKRPCGSESGGLEAYAVNVAKILAKEGVKVSFAYSYSRVKPAAFNKNDLLIKTPDIPLFDKLIFNIRLYQHLKRIKWKGVIHINGDNGILCTRLKNVHTLFTLHGSALQYSKVLVKKNPFNIPAITVNILSGFMELYAYITSDIVTGVSEYCLDFMKKFKRRSVKIIPPGINSINERVSKTKYRESLGFNGSDLLLVFVGAGGRRKGLDCAIKAMESVESANAKLLIVGPKIKPKINSKCIFFGRVSDNMLKKLYSISDVLFFPSTYEGFPTVIPEAMSFGCVPLVYSIKPFTEIVNNKNSFLAKKCSDYSRIIDSVSHKRTVLKKKQNICRAESKNFLTKKLFNEYINLFMTLSSFNS